MIRAILSLALASIVGAAHAGAYYIARPPVPFDHAFRGPTTIRFLTLEQLAHLCGGPALGCTAIGGARCDINIARIGQDAELIRHERAHCNGWPAWHPALAWRSYSYTVHVKRWIEPRHREPHISNSEQLCQELATESIAAKANHDPIRAMNYRSIADLRCAIRAGRR